jgi:proline iminopeptidase
MIELRILYPEIQPYRNDFFQVDDIHSIYWEESGNPKAQPILFLHGGPGSGTEPKHRRFFNPKKYRIILFDQRGCGKSTPHNSLENNTTWDLVADIEKLRKHLDIDQWIIFGGSWGSTLALAYAETYPENVRALIVRGIFLGRKKELAWYYQFGAHHLFPDVWEKFISPIPHAERNDLMRAYHKRLTSSDAHTRQRAALAWSNWEAATLKIEYNPQLFQPVTDATWAEAHARIECHYFMQNCFFDTDNWLLENIQKIQHIPGIIIHGRYDILCPLENAWELHKAWPRAKFEIIPLAGHSGSDPGIIDALIRATDSFE